MDFDVIDAHVHLYPDKIAEKVTAALGRKFGNPPAFVATVSSCAAFLKLPFSDEERRLVLAANARRLFGIEDEGRSALWRTGT